MRTVDSGALSAARAPRLAHIAFPDAHVIADGIAMILASIASGLDGDVGTVHAAKPSPVHRMGAGEPTNRGELRTGAAATSDAEPVS